jgi:hypothetical protein
MEINYELAKKFVQDASRAHVKSHDVVRYNSTDLEGLFSEDGNLSICFGSIFVLGSESTRPDFSFSNDFGFNKPELNLEDFFQGEKYGAIEASYQLFNGSNVGAEDHKGRVWFVGYHFELEYRYGPDMLAELDFENDVDPVSGWEYNSGAWLHTSGTTNLLIDTPKLTEGEMYQVIATITGMTAGTVVPVLADTVGDEITEDGEYTMNILAGGGDDALSFSPSSDFDGKISVRPILKERIDAN